MEGCYLIAFIHIMKKLFQRNYFLLCIEAVDLVFLKPLGLTFARKKLPHRSRYDVFFSVSHGTSSQLFFSLRDSFVGKLVNFLAFEALVNFCCCANQLISKWKARVKNFTKKGLDE